MSVNSRTAWVTLQEANAVAELDVVGGSIKSISPLGTKDHSLPNQGLDASDQDGPRSPQGAVRGMYMPDAIAAFQHERQAFLVTATRATCASGTASRGPGTTTELARAGSLSAQLDASLPAGLEPPERHDRC